MSATTETLAFAIGMQVGSATCTKGEALLAVARMGLEAAGKLGQHSGEMELQRAMRAFQGAADSLKAELREQRRVA